MNTIRTDRYSTCPLSDETPRARQLAEIDKELFRFGLAFTLSAVAVVLMLVLSSCALLPRFVPQCEGEPSIMPCYGACKVKLHLPLVEPSTKPLSVDRTMPNALVIRDHTGEVRCQEVEG